MTAAVLNFAGNFVVFTYFADLVVNLYGNATISIPLILLLTGTAGAVGNNLSGGLTDKLGAVVGLPGILLWSLAAWGFSPPQQTRLLEHASEAPTTALAANASASQFGIGIGGLIGGAVIAVASTEWLPAAGAVLVVVAIATNRSGTGSETKDNSALEVNRTMALSAEGVLFSDSWRRSPQTRPSAVLWRQDRSQANVFNDRRRRVS